MLSWIEKTGVSEKRCNSLKSNSGKTLKLKKGDPRLQQPTKVPPNAHCTSTSSHEEAWLAWLVTPQLQEEADPSHKEICRLMVGQHHPQSLTQIHFPPDKAVWWASLRWLTILSHYYDRQISLRPPGWWDLNTPTPGGTLPKFSKASFMWIFMLASCVPQSWHGKNRDNESKGVTCISAFSHAFENMGSEGANGIHTWTLLQRREGVYDHLCTMFRKM